MEKPQTAGAAAHNFTPSKLLAVSWKSCFSLLIDSAPREEPTRPGNICSVDIVALNPVEDAVGGLYEVHVHHTGFFVPRLDEDVELWFCVVGFNKQPTQIHLSRTCAPQRRKPQHGRPRPCRLWCLSKQSLLLTLETLLHGRSRHVQPTPQSPT